jgi:hypothetical protein
VIVVERDPDLLCCLDGGGVERVRLVVGGHAEQTAGAVVLGLAAAEVLRPLEQREDVLVTPSLAAVGRPRVVVAAVPADVDHPVQAARPAEHPAARDLERAVVAPRLRHRRVGPVVGTTPQLPEPARILDRRVLVHAARFDHAHACTRIDQPAGDDRAAAARADHDHVV